MACNAEVAPTIVSTREINQHPLLTREQQRVAKALRKVARNEGRDLTMLTYADIALRSAGREYVEVDDRNGNTAIAARDLHRHAVLYVYEALKATDLDIVRQWEGFDEMLRSLEYLLGDLP